MSLVELKPRRLMPHIQSRLHKLKLGLSHLWFSGDIQFRLISPSSLPSTAFIHTLEICNVSFPAESWQHPWPSVHRLKLVDCYLDTSRLPYLLPGLRECCTRNIAQIDKASEGRGSWPDFDFLETSAAMSLRHWPSHRVRVIHISVPLSRVVNHNTTGVLTKFVEDTHPIVLSVHHPDHPHMFDFYSMLSPFGARLQYLDCVVSGVSVPMYLVSTVRAIWFHHTSLNLPMSHLLGRYVDCVSRVSAGFAAPVSASWYVGRRVYTFENRP